MDNNKCSISLVPILLPPKRQQVGAASLLKTLHLRSCALVVLSRGGVIDHMSSVEDAESRTAMSIGAIIAPGKSFNGRGSVGGQKCGGLGEGGNEGRRERKYIAYLRPPRTTRHPGTMLRHP